MQDQFLDVIDRDEAERRFREAVRLLPLPAEMVPLAETLARVLAEDVVADVDVPSFDRSNYDGYAVRAADTFRADEERPRKLQLLPEVVATGLVPQTEIVEGATVAIATGAMLPRGADAVLMVEHADEDGSSVLARRAVKAGFGVAYAGTDISAGEIVLRRGQRLGSRETGVLAAIGVDTVPVRRRPLVGIVSTGDEIIAPGEAMRAGMIYDSNMQILADAVRELGGEPVRLGIVRDATDALRKVVQQAIDQCDVVVLSGGTSKGAGDLCYRVVRELDDPGIVAHGVALKPGKPICLAASQGKPVVILPGFPTSAIFTFHEFVAPVIRQLAGLGTDARDELTARMAVKVNSEIGRTEYLLVGLVPRGTEDGPPLAAYPMGKGSGSVTTFSRADGFVTIGRHEEIVEQGTEVRVQLLSKDARIADLVVIGSHCLGLDLLLSRMNDRGWQTKYLAVGSTGGLHAAARGECDVAGIHLLDPATGLYNEPFLSEGLTLLPGYGRLQGVLHRSDDPRFVGLDAGGAIERVKHEPNCVMVNRNQGSGTRILIDKLLAGVEPTGYAVQSRNHNAVAAAVAQGRADWGVAIESVARRAQLGFLPLTHEQYDFVVPKNRLDRPAVIAFRELLKEPDICSELAALGFERRSM